MRKTMAALTCALPALALLTGCGGSTATVSGTVTHQGKTVTSGQVSLLGTKTGKPCAAEIQSDGTFSIANVPFDRYKVTVVRLPAGYQDPGEQLKKEREKLRQARDRRPDDPDKKLAQACQVKASPEGVPTTLPQKYALHASTDLAVEVGQAEVRADLALKD
jgi:hypothetical protein